MRTRFFVSVAVCLLLVGSAFAFTSSVGSGKITASKVVVNQPCYITAVSLRDDATNALTVSVYDSAEETTSASRLIYEQKIEAGGDRSASRVWMLPRKCEYGIYIVISGGTGWAIVEYAFN